MHIKHESVEHNHEMDKLEQHPKQSSKGYAFGPFTPEGIPLENKNVRPIHDWENLACTYKPQYLNQGTFFDSLLKNTHSWPRTIKL